MSEEYVDKVGMGNYQRSGVSIWLQRSRRVDKSGTAFIGGLVILPYPVAEEVVANAIGTIIVGQYAFFQKASDGRLYGTGRL